MPVIAAEAGILLHFPSSLEKIPSRAGMTVLGLKSSG